MSNSALSTGSDHNGMTTHGTSSNSRTVLGVDILAVFYIDIVFLFLFLRYTDRLEKGHNVFPLKKKKKPKLWLGRWASINLLLTSHG